MTGTFVSIIIPAFNEEKYIEKTIRSVMELSYQKEVIVVDDGSQDNTKKILSLLEPIYKELQVISLEHNQGKGQALMQGVKRAKGEILVFLDADLGETSRYATNLIDPVMQQNIDMTIAILPKTKKKAGFGLVKGLAQKGIYKITGFKSMAPLSGQRVMKRDVMTNIDRLDKGFGIEVGLTIDVLKQGFQIQEVEIPFSHRETGRDLQGFIHRGKEFIDVFITLVGKWRMSE
ncbi:glycosyltransferase family 2 protein [Tepidibacillus fermentans]|uniref:Glucosyl-3-phosphoglycerate synthase n=1 Tax=Tepidibacillus fermentans TaxID=1281767 RepID=A0A4R3KKM1_9BACI|nr:glycosyltransferase family 2 protein [Tepidibacillus fermentans]TCS84052.1 glycosyl transferase family 2 [Tepidibacillus fermentans]